MPRRKFRAALGSAGLRPASLALAALPLAALSLSGCATASDLVPTSPPSSSSPEPTTSQRTATLPLDGEIDKDLPDVGDPMRAFRSPSGNIVCRLDDTGARCDIDDYAFKPPPRPEGCESRWGGTVVVDADSAHFTCGAPALAGISPELAYGKSTVVGDYGCTSQRTGVTCLNTESKHGFVVSRDRTGTF